MKETLINLLQIPTKRLRPKGPLHYTTDLHHSDSDKEIYFECPLCKAGTHSLMKDKDKFEIQKHSFTLKKTDPMPNIYQFIDFKSCPDCGKISLIRSA